MLLVLEGQQESKPEGHSHLKHSGKCGTFSQVESNWERCYQHFWLKRGISKISKNNLEEQHSPPPPHLMMISVRWQQINKMQTTNTKSHWTQIPVSDDDECKITSCLLPRFSPRTLNTERGANTLLLPPQVTKYKNTKWTFIIHAHWNTEYEQMQSTNGQSKNIEIPGPGCRQVQKTNIQKYKLQIQIHIG